MKVALRDFVLTIKDGSGTPKTVDVKIGDGNLTWEQKRAIEYVKDRGRLDTTRLGDEEPVDVRMDFVWESLKGATGAPTPYEALTKTGEAASWVSSATDACEPYAVDLEFVYTPPCGTTPTDQTILFSDFRWETLSGDPKAGTISVSGKANILAPTIS